MRRMKTLPLVLALAGLASACATNQPLERSAEGVVDPATDTLNPEFRDSTFSLAAVIEQRMPGTIDGNDRRLIDQSLDETLARRPAAAASVWNNAGNDNSGSVDLMDWIIDSRQQEACGILNHRETIGEERLEGSVTICRSNLDPSWRIDTVNWVEQEPANRQPEPPRARTTPQPQPPAPARRVSPVQTEERLSDGRVITRTDPGDIIPDEPGQQNVGDLLQDQSPHRPAQ